MTQSTEQPLIYLLSIEDVVQSPIIHSQVVALLQTIHQQYPERPIVLLSLYPILNWLKYRQRLVELHAEFSRKEITLHVWPLLYLTRYFYIPRLLWPLYWIQALIYAVLIRVRFRPALLHCRSYPAAVVGRLIKKLLSLILAPCIQKKAQHWKKVANRKC